MDRKKNGLKAPEPYKNGVDCFVLTPLYELPGIEPPHCSDASPRVGDKMTAATFNGLAPCKVSNPMFNGQYLELCADSRLFQTGFSGASIIMDESGTGAMAMLVMIGDYGDRPRKRPRAEFERGHGAPSPTLRRSG